MPHKAERSKTLYGLGNASGGHCDQSFYVAHRQILIEREGYFFVGEKADDLRTWFGHDEGHRRSPSIGA